MAGALLPPHELAPPPLASLTVEQRIALWADLLDACEQFLLAGLQLQVGPGGDLQAAYRDWHRQHMEEHDRMMRRLLEEFERRGARHAR